MNFKQKEVLDSIMKKLQEQFPEVEMLTVEELKSNCFWVSVTELPDEEQQFELDDLMAELATDALMDYGFEFQFVPTRVTEAARETASQPLAA